MKNKYIKYTILAIAITSVLAFTVFKHEHTFAEATCTTPKTCTECNEIEGEALGHSWLEATCTASETCEVCNLTEGNPLEHTWLEATTEAPETCDSCGLTQGEPLVVYSTGSDVEIDEGDYNETTNAAPEEPQASQSTEATGENSVAIQRLNSLLEKGYITQERYDNYLESIKKSEEMAKQQPQQSQSWDGTIPEGVTVTTGMGGAPHDIEFGKGDYSGLEHYRIN